MLVSSRPPAHPPCAHPHTVHRLYEHNTCLRTHIPLKPPTFSAAAAPLLVRVACLPCFFSGNVAGIQSQCHAWHAPLQAALVASCLGTCAARFPQNSMRANSTARISSRLTSSSLSRFSCAIACKARLVFPHLALHLKEPLASLGPCGHTPHAPWIRTQPC